MPSPQTLLPWLLGGAIGAAGLIQGLHWKAVSPAADVSDLETQLRLASDENELLRRENEALRSLAQGGGELSVPQDLIQRTERDTGLRFFSSPVLHRIAPEEMRDRISAAIESRLGPSGIDDRQEAYSLIGWLRPDDDLLTQLATVPTLGTGGWFDEVSGEAWMLEKTDLKNIPEQGALLRLLTRILLHQHFPPPPSYPGDDAARARDSLHQGAAAGTESRFLAEMARQGFIPMKEDKDAQQRFAALSPFIQSIANFSVLEGKGRADTLHLEGNEPFQNAFRAVPRTTRAILFPADEGGSPPPLALPATPEEPFLSESGGLLGLRTWLESLADAATAIELSSCWKNDRYLLFPDGEASSAILWDIELDQPAAADRLLALAPAWITSRGGDPAAPAPLGILETPEKRHLAVTRVSPTRIRLLNTAEANTARTLASPAP